MTRPQHRTRGRTPTHTPIDPHRVNRAMDLLNQGATVEERDSGLVRLILDGQAVMQTEPRTIRAARKQIATPSQQSPALEPGAKLTGGSGAGPDGASHIDAGACCGALEGGDGGSGSGSSARGCVASGGASCARGGRG